MDLGSINIGDTLLTAVGFLIVNVLNGIRNEIKEVKTTVQDLNGAFTHLDKRVVKLETLRGVDADVRD